jgi:Phosphoenolpyruvate phosphomutase
MNQTDKAKRFAELHVKGAPLLLYNAWDAGSAKSILAAGAQAIATSSWSVAEAQGYRDGEAIPIELAQRIVGRIVATIEAPVTVDFEGGYSEDDGELADNISRLLDTGVIKCSALRTRRRAHQLRSDSIYPRDDGTRARSEDDICRRRAETRFPADSRRQIRSLLALLHAERFPSARRMFASCNRAVGV